MELLTAELRAALPAIGATSNAAEPVALVKFFFPAGAATWFATEFDGIDLFFGWALLFPGCGELGYFSLSELEGISVHGLTVERDLYFKPCPLPEAIKPYE